MSRSRLFQEMKYSYFYLIISIYIVRSDGVGSCEALSACYSCLGVYYFFPDFFKLYNRFLAFYLKFTSVSTNSNTLGVSRLILYLIPSIFYADCWFVIVFFWLDCCLVAELSSKVDSFLRLEFQFYSFLFLTADSVIFSETVSYRCLY